MTNLDSILNNRDVTFSTKVCLVKAMVSPVVMYGCESWIIKKAECQRIDAFWTVVLEKTLESPLDCKEIQPVHPKGNQSGCSLEGLCWSWNSNTLASWCEELTHWKRPCCWERLGAGGEGDDRGWDGWMVSPTQMDIGLGGLWELVMDRESWHAAVPRVTTSWTHWATELNWTRFLCNIDIYSIGLYIHHQSHPQLDTVFVLTPSLHSLRHQYPACR